MFIKDSAEHQVDQKLTAAGNNMRLRQIEKEYKRAEEAQRLD